MDHFLGGVHATRTDVIHGIHLLAVLAINRTFQLFHIVIAHDWIGTARAKNRAMSAVSSAPQARPTTSSVPMSANPQSGVVPASAPAPRSIPAAKPHATPGLRPDAERIPKPRRRALIVLPVLMLLAAGSLTTAMLLGRHRQTTDDAQVEAHVANVAPRIGGQVVRVLVKDNQRVRAGDVLVELDDRDLNIRLASARADFAAAQAQLHAMQTQLVVTKSEVDSNLIVARGGVQQAAAMSGTTQAIIAQAHADIDAARAQRTLADTELERTAHLVSSGALSQAQYDIRKANLEQAEATLAQTQARLASAESNLGNSAGGVEAARGRFVAAQSGPQRIEAATAQVELAQARVDQARAALDQATLNQSYTRLRAEVSGVVSRRSVEVGQMVSPERPLMALVDTDDTWIVANFKEDQIANLQPGARAELSVDAFHGQTFSGHVESLSSGTGARFSLLPPDNASGNFTKVVQRVPVLIRLDPHPGITLRAGMSATTSVFTH
jgi:membrane fusion protein (multidrug efflux system)